MASELGSTDQASCGNGIGGVLNQFAKCDCEPVGAGTLMHPLIFLCF